MMTTCGQRLLALLLSVRAALGSRKDLLLENQVLRQQLITLKAQHPLPRVSWAERIGWVWLRRLWSGWKSCLHIVKPETVVAWHRKGFRLYWSFVSRNGAPSDRAERKREIRRLIPQLASENPTWGAPRIHGELVKLGFRLSERTVSRYMPRRRPTGDRRSKWWTFIENHRHAIAAMDLFVVPTLFFRPLYGFFIITHERRQVLHFNVTFRPTAAWVKTQLETAFSKAHGLKYLLFDRDSIFSPLVLETLRALGIEAIRTSYRSPWQNGVAERWIGSFRRDVLDHVIVLSEKHLLALGYEYIEYHHHDRTHYNLEKDCPFPRPVLKKPSAGARLVSMPRLGGLHHRYTWRDAA